MKTFLRTAVLVSVLALGACSSASEHLSFHATYGPTIEDARKTDLSRALSRVIEGRVASMKGKVSNLVNTQTDTGPDVSFDVAPGSLAAPLTQQLLSDFSFQLMRQAKVGEKPDITLNEAGGFMSLGITEKDVLWLDAGKDAKNMGTVQILFTADGKKKVKQAMASTRGSKVALVIRNQLVSTFQSQGEAKENIVIEGIPSPELASIFADDVNVGVHLTVAPRK